MEHSHLKTWRTQLLLDWKIQWACSGSTKKEENSGDTNTEQANHWRRQEEVEENWPGCWKEQLRTKALVLKKEESLHGGGEWYQTHGNILQGLRGDICRSGSSPQASEQQVRMIQLCLTLLPLKVKLLLTHPQIIPYSMFFQPACGNWALPLQISQLCEHCRRSVRFSVTIPWQTKVILWHVHV